jgi:seryl-tRNA synthetase
VTARTIRKWIETFEEYIQPDWNERGHYVLSEDSLKRLNEIKNRLQEQPQKSMKQVREELVKEGKIDSPAVRHESPETEQALQVLMESVENVGDLVEELFERMERMENHIYSLFSSLEEMEHKLIAACYETVSTSEMQQMFDEIRKKQDQLRMELRNVTFTQRLTATTSEQGLLPRRQKKTRFFGLL